MRLFIAEEKGGGPVFEPFANLTSNQVVVLAFGIMGLTVILVLWADRIRDRA